MVSSITDDDSIQQMMSLMFQKMSAADTDGTEGLSLDELSSIDTSGDAGGAAFLQSLTNQFDQLDADGNGQLSDEEISSAMPVEPLGLPPGVKIESLDDSLSAVDATEEAEATEATEVDSTTNTIADMIENIIKEALEKLKTTCQEIEEKMPSDKTVDTNASAADDF